MCNTPVRDKARIIQCFDSKFISCINCDKILSTFSFSKKKKTLNQ